MSEASLPPWIDESPPDSPKPADGKRVEPPPVRWREFVAVGLLVALADLTIYRGSGYAGGALLLAIAPWLLMLGAPRPRWPAALGLVMGFVLLTAARLAWCGWSLAVLCGYAWLVATAMLLAGHTPYVGRLIVFPLQAIAAGAAGLVHYAHWARRSGPSISRTAWLAVAMPLAVTLLFGGIFVLANPDLARSVSDALVRAWDRLSDFFRTGPRVTEVLFWLAVAWLTVGMLRPLAWLSGLVKRPDTVAETTARPAGSPSALYVPWRNTLLGVIALFAVYLVFEFATLWFREFPKGFYYAGYAHEGAAWLTLALALATVVLSLAFRGRLLEDPRAGWLRRLAWLWSAENVVLALAVYNRLFIYVDFNGMTRMRVVGLFGMTAVVIGFALVVVKIAQRRDFSWLVERHLWTVALAVAIYALTPVDTLVHALNTRRVLAGDLAPSVQISVHPIRSEGILVLFPLIRCEDPVIRDGVCALLAKWAEVLERRQRDPHWTEDQLADRLLAQKLHAHRAAWLPFTSRAKRAEAWRRFKQYAYQWY